MLKKILVFVLAASLLTACAGTPQETQTVPAETVPAAEETVVSEEAGTEDEDLLFDEDETLGDPEEGGVVSPLLAGAAASMGGVMKKYKKKDYILKNSNKKKLEWDDVKGLSEEEIRYARNEIYARHGYIFKADDLKKYFKSKKWYKGTVKSSKFDESVFNKYERYNIKYLKSVNTSSGQGGLSTASSKKKIDSYGYESGHSKLSFLLKKGTLKEKSGYYEVKAIYRLPVTVPGNMKVGESVTVSFNDLKKDKRKLTRKEDGLYEKGDSYASYYFYPTGKKAGVPIYEDSEDRVEKNVYEGKLFIRTDAVTGEGTLGNRGQMCRAVPNHPLTLLTRPPFTKKVRSVEKNQWWSLLQLACAQSRTSSMVLPSSRRSASLSISRP